MSGVVKSVANSTPRIRVGLTDDQPLFRAGIAMVINSQPDLIVEWEASDGSEAVEFIGRTPVDIVLMDLEMPRMGGIEAIRQVFQTAEAVQKAESVQTAQALQSAESVQTEQAVQKSQAVQTEQAVQKSQRAAGAPPAVHPPLPRFIVLTTFDLDDKTFEAIDAGASGFLLKSADPEFLLAAIRTVHSGSAVLAPSATANLVRRFASPRELSRDDALVLLTPREKDLFDLVAAGLSNAEIASTLHLSDATVKTHVSRILGKLELRDRVQLVIFAYHNGLV